MISEYYTKKNIEKFNSSPFDTYFLFKWSLNYVQYKISSIYTVWLIIFDNLYVFILINSFYV